jgi:hypothetical protein
MKYMQTPTMTLVEIKNDEKRTPLLLWWRHQIYWFDVTYMHEAFLSISVSTNLYDYLWLDSNGPVKYECNVINKRTIFLNVNVKHNTRKYFVFVSRKKSLPLPFICDRKRALESNKKQGPSTRQSTSGLKPFRGLFCQKGQAQTILAVGQGSMSRSLFFGIFSTILWENGYVLYWETMLRFFSARIALLWVYNGQTFCQLHNIHKNHGIDPHVDGVQKSRELYQSGAPAAHPG